jgi:ThiF family/Prokaryotic E2 family A/Prokaryotic homologs of the JAB domain
VVTGPTAGQQQALDELAEIEVLTGGQPPAFRVEKAAVMDDGRLSIDVSLDCAGTAVARGGAPLIDREPAVLLIPPAFPFARPYVAVRHRRFAGLPYVLGGRQICLYHSDSDWNPADGMFGLVARLAAWYRRAAAGRLIEPGQPLHPPLAYRLFEDADSVVVHCDLPADFEPAAAILVRRSPWRGDVVQWLRPTALNIDSQIALKRLRSGLEDVARSHEAPAFLGAVRILPRPLDFEFPASFPELVSVLSAQGVAATDLLEQLAQVWIANMLAAVPPEPADPLYAFLGAPMRGIAGAERQETHLEVWQLEAAGVVLPPFLADARKTPDAELAARLPAVRRLAQDWLREAPLAWGYLQEARGQIVTRRDHRKPAQWLLGKSVVVLGCGALGARIAEHCVRAGVSKLIIADHDGVGPGVLVRQPYTDEDIGLAKALQLAERLTGLRTSVEIAAEVGDVRQTILGDDAVRPGGDLIVDATANRGVSARIEWLRRIQGGWPPVLTVGVGHDCERMVGALALPHASGAGTDIMQSFADAALRDEALSDAAKDFFSPPDPGALFQPEVGCSEPTFTGSDPEVAAAAGLVFTWSLGVLSQYAAHQPVSPKSLFFARQPGQRSQAAHVFLDWPNDVTADDPRSGYQVRIRPQAMAAMRAEALATSRLYPGQWETGGLLLGSFDDACRVVWITDAGAPSPDSQRGEQAFLHGIAGVAEQVARHHQASGGQVRFAGLWHSHPGLAADASHTDDQAMATMLVPVAGAQVPRRAVRLIVGGAPDRWYRWLQGIGQPEISFRLFKRSQILTAAGDHGPAPEQEH